MDARLFRLGDHSGAKNQAKGNVGKPVRTADSSTTVSLPKGLKIKMQYWSRLTGVIDNKGHSRSVSFTLDSFVSTRSRPVIRSFNIVRRILTVTAGTLTKVFLLVEEVRRDTDRETLSAPYDLFVLTGDAFMLPIEAVEPCNLHFVPCDEEVSGWW